MVARDSRGRFSSGSGGAVDPDLDLGGQISLRDAFSKVADKVRGSLASLQNSFQSAGEKITGAIHRITGGLSSFAGVGLVAGFVALTRSAVSSASALQTNELAFTTLMHSADAAREHLQMLREFAIGKPFEFNDLVTASRGLQGFGFQASQVRQILTDVGDAVFSVGGNAEAMNGVLRQIGQIKATGRATAQDLNAIANHGIPIHAILREQLHLTGEQVREIAKSGISTDRILTAMFQGMHERYGGGMERASRTITARLSDLKDRASAFMVKVGERVIPTINRFLTEFENALSPARMSYFANVVGDTISTVVNVVRIVVQPLLGAFSDIQHRWSHDTDNAGTRLRRWATGLRDVIEGVTALVTSENHDGIATIPKSIRDKLVNQGLWPLTVRIAQFFSRARAFVKGFVGEMLDNFNRTKEAVESVGRALGITTGQFPLSRDGATSLGVGLADLIAWYFKLKIILGAVDVATQAYSATMKLADTVSGAYRVTVQLGGSAMQALNLTTRLSTAATWAWTAAVRGAQAAMRAFNLLFVQSRIGLYAIGVLAVAAGIYLLYTHWEELTNTVRNFWIVTAVMDGAHKAIAFLGRVLRPVKLVFEAIILVVYTLGAAITYILYEGIVGVVTGTIELFRWMGTEIAHYATIAWVFIREKAHEAWEWIAVNVVDPVSTKITRALDRVQTFAGRVWSWVAHRAHLAFDFIWAKAGPTVTKIVKFFEPVGRFFARLWNGIVSGLTAAATTIREVFANIGDHIMGALRSVAGLIVDAFNMIPEQYRPEGLNAMARDLERFARVETTKQDKTTTSTDQPTLAQTPVPARGQQLIASRNVAAARAGNQGLPAPVVNVSPVVRSGPVTVQIDGRTVASVLEDHWESDDLRRGRAGRD